MKELERLKVYNQNPRAGKGKMLLGKILETGGICLVVGGGIGWLNSQINLNVNETEQNIKNVLNIITPNYEFFLKSGLGTFMTGGTLEIWGRIKHWYNNKTYYN